MVEAKAAAAAAAKDTTTAEAAAPAGAQLNVYQRVLAVMADVGSVAKEGQADARMGGFSYVRHDDVMEALHPALVKHGVVLVVEPLREACDVFMEHPATRSGTAQWAAVVWLVVTFVNADQPDDRYSVHYPGIGIDTGDKAPGKAISYAMKTALLKALCLPAGEGDNEDTDTSSPAGAGGGGSRKAASGKASGGKAKAASDEEPVNPKLRKFWIEARKAGLTDEHVHGWLQRNMSLTSSKEATDAQLAEATMWATKAGAAQKALKVEMTAAGLDQPQVQDHMEQAYGTRLQSQLTLHEWAELVAWAKEQADGNVPFGDEPEGDSGEDYPFTTGS